MRTPYPAELRSEVHRALRSWYRVDYEAGDVLESLLLIKYEKRAAADYAHRLATNQVLLHGLKALGEKNEQGKAILRRRFLDQMTAREIGFQDNLSEDSVNRLQRKALEQLTEVLWSQEMVLRKACAAELEAHLVAPSYTYLIGFDAQLSIIIDQLLADSAPYIVAIVGIGGIGKTALADKAIRSIIPQFVFDEIVAVRVEYATMSGKSASPEDTFNQIVARLHTALPNMPVGNTAAQMKSQIQQRLQERRHLILIDNIEDAADAAYLFHHIHDWGESSKFLVTTRAYPSTDRAVAIHSLTELGEADTLTLIRHEADQRLLVELAQAPDEALLPIYRVTGGNPLALKLTIRLAEVLPLPTILADLKHGSGQSTGEMYRHIYQQAWQTLSEQSQALLESMPLVGSGGATPEQMIASAGLTEAELWPAIQQLSARSLIEIRGTVWERRYGIHRLTETFLHTDIIGWPQSP